MTARIALVCLAAIVLFAGCPYSFRGGSVPPHLKTIAIPLVDDQSAFGDPSLRQNFTTELTNLFIADNSLEVADRGVADAILEGSILSVSDAPAAIQQGEQVSRRRITITAKFAFQDMKLRRTIWDKTFSNWGEYETSGGGITERQTGLTDAIRKTAEDVLLETVSGW